MQRLLQERGQSTSVARAAAFLFAFNCLYLANSTHASEPKLVSVE